MTDNPTMSPPLSKHELVLLLSNTMTSIDACESV